jgi:hypothetical protein
MVTAVTAASAVKVDPGGPARTVPPEHPTVDPAVQVLAAGRPVLSVPQEKVKVTASTA